MKTCNRCGLIKPKTDFHKRGNFQQHICKSCKRIEDHERNVRILNLPKQVVQEKLCPTCGELQPSRNFHKNRYKPDGLATQCKSCKSELAKYGSRIRNSDEWLAINEQKCKESKRRQNAKRRQLGTVTLNTWCEGWDAHHINKDYIIYIPHHLHKSVIHNVWDGKNMEVINELAFKFLC